LHARYIGRVFDRRRAALGFPIWTSSSPFPTSVGRATDLGRSTFDHRVAAAGSALGRSAREWSNVGQLEGTHRPSGGQMLAGEGAGEPNSRSPCAKARVMRANPRATLDNPACRVPNPGTGDGNCNAIGSSSEAGSVQPTPAHRQRDIPRGHPLVRCVDPQRRATGANGSSSIPRRILLPRCRWKPRSCWKSSSGSLRRKAAASVSGNWARRRKSRRAYRPMCFVGQLSRRRTRRGGPSQDAFNAEKCLIDRVR
jgi:hypothetical protein